MKDCVKAYVTLRGGDPSKIKFEGGENIGVGQYSGSVYLWELPDMPRPLPEGLTGWDRWKCQQVIGLLCGYAATLVGGAARYQASDVLRQFVARREFYFAREGSGGGHWDLVRVSPEEYDAAEQEWWVPDSLAAFGRQRWIKVLPSDRITVGRTPCGPSTI